MKSTSHGISMWRMRSARKKTAPFRTPTSSRSRSAYSALMASPSARTRSLSSSGCTRISPIWGSRIACRSLCTARGKRRRGLEADHAALDDRSRTVADVESAVVAEREDVRQPDRGAGAQTPGGGLREVPDDEPSERLRQRGELRGGDPIAPVE